MFDDIDNIPQTSATPLTQPATTFQPRPRPIQPMPPSNLPLGGQTASLQPAANAPVAEDIFNQTDNAIPIVAPQAPLSPLSSVRQSALETPMIAPLGGVASPLAAPLPPMMPSQGGGGFRKAIVFFLSAFVVAFLGIGAYLVYRIMKARTSVDVLNQPIENGAQAEPQVERNEPAAPSVEPEEQAQEAPKKEEPSEAEGEAAEEGENTGTGEKIEEEAQTEPAEEPEQPPSDSDNDGLSDLEELELGSNPRVIDTDLDGLDDYSEARVYRSNPVRRDTDGDSYDDGLEVQNGYNPTGQGRLTSE